MINKIKTKRNSKPKPLANEKNKQMTVKDYEDLGRTMEQVFTSGYANKSRLIYMSFIKGIGYGLGIFIGGTIVVGIVLTTLVQFEEVPIIGPLAQKINNSIQKGSEADINSIKQDKEQNQ